MTEPNPQLARGQAEIVTRQAAEEYLHRHIPISRKMGIRVTSLDENGVTLCAPLSPNLNHEATAFGGSISALAILTAWTYLYAQLQGFMEPSRIVIQRSQVQYLSPIRDEFCASCSAPPAEEWNRFLELLNKRGKARITIRSDAISGCGRVAAFEGTYVAMK